MRVECPFAIKLVVGAKEVAERLRQQSVPVARDVLRDEEQLA